MSDKNDTYSLSDGRVLSLSYPGDLTAAEVAEVADWLALLLKKFRRCAAESPLSQLGSAGGKARAAKLTPKQRSETARKAANARWGNGADANHGPAPGIVVADEPA